jgi:hypothetical protein
MKKLLMSAALALPLAANAVDITVGTGVCNGSYVAICSQMDQEVRDLVEGDLPEVSIGEYGTGLANANSFAYKGLDSDYSDKFTYFMVRGGGGAAVQGEIDNPESAEGIGIGAAVTAGINLDLLPIDKIGPVELNKMDLMVSLMSWDLDETSEDTTIKGDLGHFSVMARYQIMEGQDIVPGYMLEWGGVFLHTGFHRQSFEAKITQSFNDEEVEVSGQTATFNNASATFELETATTTIPVEVSTYLRAGYVFTFFGGAGFDLVNGSTDVSLDAAGNINGGSGGNTYANTISASESDSGDADVSNLRAFGGIQFNVPFVRVTTHFNKGLGNDLFGANVAVKILW